MIWLMTMFATAFVVTVYRLCRWALDNRDESLEEL